MLRRLHDVPLTRGWRGGLVPLILLALLLLVGPLSLLLVWLLWRWAIASRWDAAQRWAGVKGFAASGLLVDLALFLLRAPLAHLWIALHIPGVPTLATLWVRWAMAVSLSPALALVRERIQPATFTLSARMIRIPEKLSTSRAPETDRRSARAPRSAHRAEKTAERASAGNKRSAPRSVKRGPSRKSTATRRDPRPIHEVWIVPPGDSPALPSSSEEDRAGESLNDLL